MSRIFPTFEAGTVVTASGNSSPADLLNPANGQTASNPQNLSVMVQASSVAGTSPSLTIEVQWSNDNVTYVSAATPDVFTAITANGNVVKQFPIKGRYARLKYTVTGTGGTTFTLLTTGVAV